jgi:hypothetical protein
VGPRTKDPGCHNGPRIPHDPRIFSPRTHHGPGMTSGSIEQSVASKHTSSMISYFAYISQPPGVGKTLTAEAQADFRGTGHGLGTRHGLWLREAVLS